MKNNLIFTDLHEVRDENTEELLRTFLYKEIGVDYRIHQSQNSFLFGVPNPGLVLMS
jgi:hypothetical protein